VPAAGLLRIELRIERFRLPGNFYHLAPRLKVYIVPDGLFRYDLDEFPNKHTVPLAIGSDGIPERLGDGYRYLLISFGHITLIS
jgi:hypothetical protein